MSRLCSRARPGSVDSVDPGARASQAGRVVIEADDDRDRALRDELARIAAQLDRLDLVGYEELRADRAPLLREVSGLVQRALDALAAGAGLGERRPERREVGDLCAVARDSLTGRHEQLARLTAEHPRWDIIEAVHGVVEELQGISCVVGELVDPQGATAGRCASLGLRTSLEIRRTYATFLKEVLGSGEPSEATVQRRLRLVATTIAKLTGREIYAALRVSDRRQFRELQERIIAWLREPETLRSPREGVRIWQDVEAVARIMRQLSCRAQLRSHDTAVLERLVPALRQIVGAGEPIPGRWLTELKSLCGLCDVLDELVGQVPPDAGKILARAERLLDDALAPSPAPLAEHERDTECIDLELD